MKTVTLKVSDLIQHPLHKRLYIVSKVEALAESMNELGLLEPIVINKKKEVLSGWLRLLAARLLGWKEIPAIIRDDIPPAKEIEFILDFNKQRVKSMIEKWNEIQELQKRWGKKQGERTDKNPNLSNEEKKHTNDRIAEHLGISTGNLSKIKTIASEQQHLLAFIDKGEMSIHQAYLECKEEVDSTADEKDSTKLIPERNKSQSLVKQATHKCPKCGCKFHE